MSEEEKIMLETNQSITNMETCFRNKIKELQQENKQLKSLYETQTNFNKELLNKFAKKDRVLKELRSWLEDEKDRLARECSQIYEDSLGKTRLVNEDIFNEVNKILSKLKELEGKNE